MIDTIYHLTDKTKDLSMERRTVAIDFRKMAGTGRKIRGTAVVFNQPSDDLGGFREVIAPEAFGACDMEDIRCLLNHDGNFVLGRTKSGSLSLWRDSRGLQFECNLPDTTYASDLAESMKRGDINQCSFSFTVAPGGAQWDKNTTGLPTRTVRKISRLYDVSVVTYPAYPQTSSDIRTAADILSERQTSENLEAPPASSGWEMDLLRRKLELEFYGRQ